MKPKFVDVEVVFPEDVCPITGKACEYLHTCDDAMFHRLGVVVGEVSHCPYAVFKAGEK